MYLSKRNKKKLHSLTKGESYKGSFFSRLIQTILWKGGLNMTYKQIEASREVRLWIGQVIVPAIALTMAIPEARKKVIDKSKSIKRSIDERFKKTN